MDEERNGEGLTPSEEPINGAGPQWPETDTEAAGNESSYPEVELEPILDPGFDDVPPARRARKKSKKKRRARRNVSVVVLLCSVVAVAVGIAIYFFVAHERQQAAEIAAQLAAEEALRVQQEQQKAEFEQLANSTVFLNGISINGVSVGGMSMAEAKAAVEAAVASAAVPGELQLTYGDKLYSISLATILTKNDLDDVLSEAYRLGKTGDYASMKADKEDILANGRVFTVSASCDQAALRASVTELAAGIDTPEKDASIASVDTETRTFVFNDPVTGVTVQQEELVKRILEAITAGNYAPIPLPVTETEPEVTKEELSAKYILRGSATTNFSTSASTRKYNIRKGAGIINGTILKPGDVFSTNDTLGTRTERNGWKLAGAYESGATVEQAGGGVCQLSTTLYNAVVKSDLEVVSRRNHSMPVAYIDKGLDATINSVGNIIDFKFKNNTTSDVVVFAYTTNNKTVTFEIWGMPFSTTEYDEIKLTSKQLAVYEPETGPTYLEKMEGAEKTDGSKLTLGEEYVCVAPRKGYLYQSYKNYYKAGTLVRTEELASSTYKSFVGEIWLCTMTADGALAPIATPEPEPTHEGDAGYVPDQGAVTPPADAGAVVPENNLGGEVIIG